MYVDVTLEEYTQILENKSDNSGYRAGIGHKYGGQERPK